MREHTEKLRTGPDKANVAFYAAAILCGVTLGSLVPVIPPMYLLFLTAGLSFAWLLLFKIEVAIILALFLQNILGGFNYLGGGTPFHPNGVMGIALIAGAILFFSFNKVEIPFFRRVGWFLLFFLVCLISTLMAPGRYFRDSLTVTLRLAAALAIFVVLLVKLDSIRKTKWVLGAILAAQVLPTVSGLLLYAGTAGLSFTWQTSRLGDSGVGVYLAMMLAVCLVFLLDIKTAPGRFLWGSLTALYGLGLFFSFGRGGWIAFVVALILIGLLRHRWLLVVAPLLLVVAILLVPGITERFADISLQGLGGGSSTLDRRVQIWRAALDLSSNQPVLGVGAGVGRFLVGESLHQYSWMIHNDYVSVLLEVGLVGFILFLLWHGQWLASLFGVFRHSEHTYDKTLALGVLAVLIASLVGRFTDNILLDSYDMYPLCALAAAGMSLPRIRALSGTYRG